MLPDISRTDAGGVIPLPALTGLNRVTQLEREKGQTRRAGAFAFTPQGIV